jgi:hypothetical protein
VSAPPFSLSPNPDEILGSFLSRLRLHNGKGWWHVALRDAGYGARSDENVFDIPGSLPTVDALLYSAGLSSREETMLNLTTLPYWLAFDAAPAEGNPLPGTTLNALLGTKKGRVQNVSAMARRYRARAGIRFCPVCISDDVRTFGEPYWHRTHQLPNVTCCPTHRTRLLHSCPRCGRVYLADESACIPLLRLQCQCGCKLTEACDAVDKTDIRYKLAIVSRDALQATEPLCSRSQMRNFIRSRIHSRDLVSILEKAFGQAAVLRDTPLPNRDRNDLLWLPLPPRFSQFRAPDCCALLAAMDLSFSSAQRSAAIVEEAPREREDCGRPRTVPSIKSAKKSMLERIDKGQRISASVDSLNYWVLRLFDPDWLREHFPRSRLTTIPSVQVDRDFILDLAADPTSYKRSTTYHWRLVAQSVAGRRAVVRDASWFESQRRKYFGFDTESLVRPRNKAEIPQLAKSVSAITRHVSALQSALQKTLNDAPHERITLAKLALTAGITLPMAIRSLRENPALAFEIRSARSRSRRRA